MRIVDEESESVSVWLWFTTVDDELYTNDELPHCIKLFNPITLVRIPHVRPKEITQHADKQVYTLNLHAFVLLPSLIISAALSHCY